MQKIYENLEYDPREVKIQDDFDALMDIETKKIKELSTIINVHNDRKKRLSLLKKIRWFQDFVNKINNKIQTLHTKY